MSTTAMAMHGRMPMSGHMGGGGPMPGQPVGRSETPAELFPYLVALDELAHAPQPLPPREHLLHVPLFFHQMSGFRGTPVFQSAPVNPGGTYTSPPFTIAATYNYICGVHGAMMSGSVIVQPGGSSSATVNMVDFAFVNANGIDGLKAFVGSGEIGRAHV